MSSPDLTSEMAYFLQDNTVEYLKGATEDELIEFVNTLLPHVSPVGVNRIYPLVAEAFPTRLKVGKAKVTTIFDGYERGSTLQATARDPMPQTMEELADDDDEVSLNPLRQPNPDREGTD